MSEDCFVFCKEEFCVPVTKMEPTESIQFIINEFVQKAITFCIYEEGDKCEIWRIVEPEDCIKIKKENEYTRPNKLFVKGAPVEYYIFKD